MTVEETTSPVISNPSFGSDLDEKAFFEWLTAVNGAKEVKGVGRTTHAAINNKEFNDEGFRRLISLYYRYNLNFDELEKFVNRNNKKWVLEPSKYWASRIENWNKNRREI